MRVLAAPASTETVPDGETMITKQTSYVDHFPEVLKHFSNERLVNLAAHYERMTSDSSPNDLVNDRLARCQLEIERRGALVPWLRRRLSRLVA